MDSEETFAACAKAFWDIIQKYRRLKGNDKSLAAMFNHMEKDFWDAQLSVMTKLNPERARLMAQRLNKDMEKYDSELSKFL